MKFTFKPRLKGNKLSLNLSSKSVHFWLTVYTITSGGIYKIEVSLDNCIFYDSITVTESNVPDKPLVNLNGSTNICEGDSLILKAPEGFSYLWSSGDTTQDVVVYTSGDYSLIYMFWFRTCF